jgi:hypothetical protein
VSPNLVEPLENDVVIIVTEDDTIYSLAVNVPCMLTLLVNTLEPVTVKAPATVALPPTEVLPDMLPLPVTESSVPVKRRFASPCTNPAVPVAVKR